jgi:hypothetical protein
VSTCNRSLAFEEIREPENHLVDLLPLRHLSISNASADVQLASQVVKVSGNITVSF